MADCRDEDEARQLLAEMREAEEVVLIKEIRGKRLTADLEAVIADAEIARRGAQSEAGSVLRQPPQDIAAEFQSLVETCQHENGRVRDPRSLGDVTGSLVPMVIADRLDSHRRDATVLHYQETDPLSRKVQVLKEAVARLQRLHDGRDELAAEASRLTAACAAFRKAYAKA